MSASVEDLINEVPNPPKDLISAESRDLDTVRRWINWAVLGIDRLTGRFLVDPDASGLLRELVLQNAFAACVYSWHGLERVGKSSLVLAWLDSSSLAGLQTDRFRQLRNLLVHQLPTSSISLTAEDGELLAVFNAAVGERLVADRAAWQDRQIIRDLLVRLGLTREEAAASLAVSASALEDWESGRTGIPQEPLARLQSASAALSKLLGIFRPERLPQVIRREVDLFEGKPALQWIMQGRIAEVADRYESVLAYQA